MASIASAVQLKKEVHIIMLELELETETQPKLKKLLRQLNFFAVKDQVEHVLLNSHQQEGILETDELNDFCLHLISRSLAYLPLVPRLSFLLLKRKMNGELILMMGMTGTC